ncbi:M14 family metallopeptidase [Oceanicoccus sagamiensis]|uniref:Peptidase M14 domain-containing protein n=1 Tax=Oceanicoccus sagamiensis TaxID=716816 RepID=A0A1X9NN47_9GAMM|nr:M14-type cytosolic carboxypeptidase [Oceanicoccus sagamiensis]ARN75323.1 hypothetical protein BST96_15090 [Oceanicoccus sagamiensis]
MVKISSQFDSGNIELVQHSKTAAAECFELNIRKDHQSDFFQWFHFRVQGAKDTACEFILLNASEAAYPAGWDDYQAVASYDREEWFRVDTAYKGKSLVITHQPEYDSVYYAYFTPYSYERHMDLLSWAQLSPVCLLQDIGNTLDGNDLSLLTIGNPETASRKIWLIARQHPGESMAEWFMEGFLQALLDSDNPTSKALLQQAVFYVVPNMNPDGSMRGHLRTNAVGANLNREWVEPTLERSPEVYYVRQKMQEIGVDLFLDIHGDEALPYNFVAGSEGVPSYHSSIQSLEESFKQAYSLSSPDFQDKVGYPKTPAGKANLSIACNYVAETFNCLSFTIEMPFKDNADLPDALYGWSSNRSAQLGRDVLVPIRAVVNDLR